MRIKVQCPVPGGNPAGRTRVRKWKRSAAAVQYQAGHAALDGPANRLTGPGAGVPPRLGTQADVGLLTGAHVEHLDASDFQVAGTGPAGPDDFIRGADFTGFAIAGRRNACSQIDQAVPFEYFGGGPVH